jgi:hypothetical protein
MAWPKGVKRGPRQPADKYNLVAPYYDRANEEPLGTVEPGGSVPSPVVVEAAPHGSDAPVPSDPPWNYRKAADFNLDPPTMPWQIVRCRECNMDMYTRNPAKRDVCEDCLWTLMQQVAEVEKTRVLRATDRMVNPFRSGDVFQELGGSLPSVKRRG